MNLVELKEFIDAHHCSDNASWQRVVFDELFEMFSVIPIVSGVYNGNSPEEIAAERKECDRKAAAIPKWEQFCTERNTTRPNWGDKIGICTGPASGILVVDVDDAAAFENFCRVNNIDTNFRTLTVQSSPGKYHLYFKFPVDGMDYRNRSQGNSGCGFDIRGNGGYVLGPGSIHPVSKSFYSILAADEIAEAPDWVKQWSLNRTLPASDPDAGAHASSSGLGDKLSHLSAELRSRITADVAVGKRSEVSISVMEALIAEGFAKEEILDVFLLHPIGAKFREKGMAWFDREFEKAAAYVASQTKAQKSKSLDMSLELYATMQEFKYYSNEGKYYCKCQMGKGTVFLDIESQEFTGMIFSRQAAKTNSTGTTQQMRAALSRLKFHALDNATPVDKICRFKQNDHGLILNLARVSGECVVITKEGCSIVPQPDILVQKDADTLPIENIELGCNGLHACDAMLELMGITNMYDQHYLKMLMVSWLFEKVATPILFFIGEPGSGKTTLASALKGVFDPTENGGAYLPETMLEMALVLSKSGIAYVDNFTDLNKKIQNGLCLAFSKGYFPKKKNYTDTETVNIAMNCPVILSSIEVPHALQNDLFSRMSFFNISKKVHVAESDLNDELNKLYPKVRGELCNLAVQILNIIDNFKALGIKRHGDFDKLGQAYCSIVADEKMYKMIMKYRVKVDSLAVIKTSNIIDVFVKFIESNKFMFATMTDIFNCLVKICDSNSIGNMNPATLSKEIRKYSSLLESIGITIVEGGKVDSGRVYLFIAEDHVDSNVAVELEKIKLNPSLICKEYCNINGIK